MDVSFRYPMPESDTPVFRWVWLLLWFSLSLQMAKANDPPMGPMPEGWEKEKKTKDIRDDSEEKGPHEKPRILLDDGTWLPPNARTAESDKELLLVGVFVNDEEVRTIEILRDEKELYIPLEPLLPLAKISLEGEEGRLRLVTPLGNVPLKPTDLHLYDNVNYLTKGFIERELQIRISFDEAEFAIRLDLPWKNLRLDRVGATPLDPEFLPPGNTVSTMRAEVTYNSVTGAESLPSNITLTGRLAQGIWRIRHDYDFESGTRRMPEYSWFRAVGKTLFQLGQQQIHLHPLLNGFAMTGAQAGYASKTLDFNGGSDLAQELLSRRVLPQRNFRGQGYPGGLVQIWIEGVIVSQQLVGLNGYYEFLDVPLPARQVSQIEVRIFERDEFQTPAEIKEYTISSSDLLLPKGVTTHLGGGGWTGNLIDQATRFERDKDDVVGFYQWRQGITDNLTVEAMGQRPGEDFQGMAGVVSRLSKHVVAAAGVAASQGELGYSLDLEGRFNKWRFLTRSESKPAELQATSSLGGTTSDRDDHSLEVRYRQYPGLEWALYGRKRKSDFEDIQYLLPGISWRPRPYLSILARPNFTGDYRLDLFYRISRKTRMAAHVDETSVLDFTHQFHPDYNLSLGAEFAENHQERFSAIVRRLNRTSYDLSFFAGVFVIEEQLGAIAGGTMQVLPGLLARVNYHSMPLSPLVDFTDEPEFQINLTTDLGFSRGKVRPSRTSRINRNLGAIAGRITIQGNLLKTNFDLKNIEIRVNKGLAARTDAWGNFFIGSLKEGIYRVTLETENLPLELIPEKTSFVAKVAAGVATSVDFVVKPEFGIAGRIKNSEGQPLPDARVGLFDPNGNLMRETSTDQFGLYRLDGLSPGEYTLRLLAIAEDDPEGDIPFRIIRITDDFLFGQDLQLAPPP